METMQREPQPENLAEHVLSVLQLSPQQRQQIALAFKCTQSQRAGLLQQQESVIKELQGLLVAGPFREGVSSNSMCKSTGGSALSNDAPGTPQLSPQAAEPAPAGTSAGAGAAIASMLHAGSPAGNAACSSAQQWPVLASENACASSTLGGSGCGGFSSAYSSLHSGLLDLEVAQKADDLLQELQRLVRLNREVSRSLIHGRAESEGREAV
jgi:hypothetical protein